MTFAKIKMQFAKVFRIFLLAGCTIFFGCAKTYNLPGGYTMYVSSAQEWEVNQLSYYEIRKGNRIVIPKTMYGANQGAGPLSSVVGGDVVGFFDADKGDQILILFNWKSEESWPFAGINEYPTDTQKRAMKMLDILNYDSKDKQWKLKE